MYIAPNTSIIILKNIPLDVTYTHTIYFSSATAQYNYFSNKKKYTQEKCSYTSPNKIRVGIKSDNLYDCNYIMYKNTNFTNKWFYAFITHVEYVNNEVAELTILIDVMQTWMFDYEIRPSFVEREHVTSDNIGEHLIDEGLAIGDYITNTIGSKYFTEWWIIVGSTMIVSNGEVVSAPSNVYGGIYSGIHWTAWNMTQAVGVLPTLLNNPELADAIVSMFMIPEDMLSPTQVSGEELKKDMREPQIIAVPRGQTLDGYVPRNKKLLSYPYRALVLSNNNGDAVTLKFENFDDDETEAIHYVGGIQPNSSIIAYPVNYLHEQRNTNNSVAISGYPQCAWTKDVYSNWLASQSIRNVYTEERFYRNALSNMINGGIKTIASANPLALLDYGASGFKTVNSQLDMYSKMTEEKEVHALIPDSVRGTVANGSTNISINKFGFMVQNRSIRSQYAKSIDEYFDMYGYKVNRVKTPNISTRPQWNYVKTIGVNIVGSCPNDDIATIKSIFDNGITFWRNGDNVGKYNLDNRI